MPGVGVGIASQPVLGGGAHWQGYGVGGLLPDLVADFSRQRYRAGGIGTPFDGLMTHMRASSATYIDSSGMIRIAAVDQPRLGHHVWDGAAWVNAGLLIETESRTNLERESVSLSNYAANAWGSSVVYGADDPFGGNQAATYTKTGVTSYAFGTLASVSQLTFSIWLKAGTLTSARIQIGHSSTGKGVYADVDLSAGTIGAATLKSGDFTPLGSSIEDFGGGWFRASVSANVGQASVGYVTDMSSLVGGAYLIYGPQLEGGVTPSSYIPTTGSSVTRAADSLTIPAAKLPYSALAMSMAMEGAITFSDNDIGGNDDGRTGEVVLWEWWKDASNFAETFISTDTTVPSDSRVGMVQTDGGTRDVVVGNGPAPGIAVPFSIASRHGATFINGAVDGTVLTADTTPTALPELSATDLQLAYDFMGTIRLFRMWGRDIGDAGIAGASA